MYIYIYIHIYTYTYIHIYIYIYILQGHYKYVNPRVRNEISSYAEAPTKMSRAPRRKANFLSLYNVSFKYIQE
jgi:hypothetical protein